MKSQQLKAGAILSYFSMGISFLVTLLYTPVMLRLLGQSDYGLFNLSASIVSNLGLLSFGFGTAYVRFFARYKVRNDDAGIARLNGLYMLIFSAVVLILFLAGAALASRAELILGANITAAETGTARLIMAVMVIDLAVTLLGTVFDCYISSNERFIFHKLLVLIKTLASPLVILPVLLLGYGSVGLAAVTLFVNILFTALSVVFCIRKLGMSFSFRSPDFTLLREMMVFSFFIFLNIISDQFNWNMNRYLLGRIKGTVAVAIYGVGATINTLYMSFSTSISHVFAPRINRMVAVESGGDKLTELFTRVGRIQFALLSLICLGFVFFGKAFITLWAGREYTEAYLIVLLLIIPVTIPLIQTIGLEILRAKNLHRFRSVVYLVVSVICTAISIPLIRAYGGIGAAAGTALTLFVGNGVIMNWYYQRKVGLNMRSFWTGIARMLPAMPLPLLAGAGIHIWANLENWSSLFLFGFLFTLAYIVSMWLFGLNFYEKDIIMIPVRKLFKNKGSA